MRTLSKFVCLLGVLSVGVAASAGAQVLLQAKQGISWTAKLTLSEMSAMYFRWKPDGRPVTGTKGMWEITYEAPQARRNPAIVKSGRITFIAGGSSEYTPFRITPGQLPANVPSRFYVRVHSGRKYSSWIPVTVEPARRAATPTLPSLAPAPPLMTAGVPNPYPPLWITLTTIICKATSSDGSPSDEIYAVVGAVALNHEKPWKSVVRADVTKVYDDMDPNDLRSVNKTLWGPPGGNPVVIRTPIDAILVVQLVEHDVGQPLLAGPLSFGAIAKAVSTFNPDMSHAAMVEAVRMALIDGAIGAFGGGGDSSSDDQIGPPLVLWLTQQEIDAARSGKVVKKELLAGSGSFGVYVMRFQMGRAGTSTVPW